MNVFEKATALHAAPAHGVFYVTGGGSSFLHDLLGTPGASKTVLEARVPYAYPALAQLLGGAPEQACAAPTARSLAMAAFQRALELADEDTASEPFGFAVTASLATDRQKRGTHRAYVAVQTSHASACYSVEFDRSLSREAQEQELNLLCWQAASALAPAISLRREPPLHTHDHAAAHPDWRALIHEEHDAVATQPHDRGVLLPGSFNPLHDGHRLMRAHGEALLGRPVAYELSIANVEKPMLDYLAIEERLAQFDAPVWLTRLPRFLDKARHFPECTFLVGADTVTRIGEVRFYENERERNAALDELNELKVRFLVFGRAAAGRAGGKDFVELSDLALPEQLAGLCSGVTEENFRIDLSSTELRKKLAEL